eukprot:1658145-Rhodomonas_salina.2
MPSTEKGYHDTLRLGYTMPGTDTGCGATRSSHKDHEEGEEEWEDLLFDQLSQVPPAPKQRHVQTKHVIAAE